jgi:hypothetical protein
MTKLGRLFAVACQLSIVAAFCIYNNADRSFVFTVPADSVVSPIENGFEKQISKGTSQCCPFTDQTCNPTRTKKAIIFAAFKCDDDGFTMYFQLPDGEYKVQLF